MTFPERITVQCSEAMAYQICEDLEAKSPSESTQNGKKLPLLEVSLNICSKLTNRSLLRPNMRKIKANGRRYH